MTRPEPAAPDVRCPDARRPDVRCPDARCPDAAQLVPRLAGLALRSLARAYPYAPAHLVAGPEDTARPGELHPAFGTGWDWHSSVHTHWLLVRLLTGHPGRLDGVAVRRAVTSSLDPAAVRTEAAYLRRSPSFERPYGWGWALRLAAACAACPDPAARGWSAALAPLVAAVTDLLPGWLADLDRWRLPVRDGGHANTAFGMALLLDGATGLGDRPTAERLAATARGLFLPDRNAPAAWEPGGADFLSPALSQADLVGRLLDPAAYARWLTAFLPGLADGRPARLLTPVAAPAPGSGDPGAAHLAGLLLTRAAAMRSVATALPGDDPRRAVLTEAAASHRLAGLPVLDAGTPVTDHWVGTFAAIATGLA